jgi:hypothetical protein
MGKTIEKLAGRIDDVDAAQAPSSSVSGWTISQPAFSGLGADGIDIVDFDEDIPRSPN